MSRRYDTVIFDLDGTLLNTLEDLADGVNAALKHFGRPERTLDESPSVCRQRRAESDGQGSAGRKGSKGFSGNL